MSFDRDAMRRELLERTEESFKTKDYGARGAYFLKDHDRPIWTCKAEKHLIDIIPFFAGPKHPRPTIYGKEGKVDYVLDVYVHRNIGVNDSQYLCPAKTYAFLGKRCPICEYLKSLDEPAQKENDDIRARRRCVYNVLVWDNPTETGKGVQIWEIAHFFFEQKVVALTENVRGGGTKYKNFSHPDDGFSISFERQGSGKDNTAFLGHQFVPREGYKITDDILRQAVCLTDLMIELSYEELYEVFHGKPYIEGSDSPTKETEKGPLADRLKDLQQKPTQEPPKKEEPASPNPCPAGGRFGIDTDKLVHCNDCASRVYKACAQEAQKSGNGNSEPTPIPQRQTPQQPPASDTSGIGIRRRVL